MKKFRSFFYRNGLSIFAVSFFLIFWMAQALTGWSQYNEFLTNHDLPSIRFGSYLLTGNFVEVTFENWESEFLQMFLYVLATVWLRQWGSSESKKLDGSEDVDAKPTPGAHAPWPVKKGGIALKIYSNSLSIAFFLLFLFSFVFHAFGSYKDHAMEETLKGRSVESFSTYMTGSKIWFESFQNWQSEFLAIASIVLLSIFLRQHGSPKSKPVDMPYNEIP